MKVLVLCFLLVSLPTFAQQKPKIKVVFECSCDDPVGSLFATAFRDALANSPRYIETDKAEIKDSAGKTVEFHFKISVVSVDGGTSNSGISTALSDVFLVGDNFYLNNMVQSCGRDRIALCAASLLSSLDGIINNNK